MRRARPLAVLGARIGQTEPPRGAASLPLWSVRGTLWGGYTACDAVSTMHEWGGEHTRRAWALFR